MLPIAFLWRYMINPDPVLWVIRYEVIYLFKLAFTETRAQCIQQDWVLNSIDCCCQTNKRLRPFIGSVSEFLLGSVGLDTGCTPVVKLWAKSHHKSVKIQLSERWVWSTYILTVGADQDGSLIEELEEKCAGTLYVMQGCEGNDVQVGGGRRAQVRGQKWLEGRWTWQDLE